MSPPRCAGKPWPGRLRKRRADAARWEAPRAAAHASATREGRIQNMAKFCRRGLFAICHGRVRGWSEKLSMLCLPHLASAFHPCVPFQVARLAR
eukprot:3378211-Alexandrium_andersonii.AAC.1